MEKIFRKISVIAAMAAIVVAGEALAATQGTLNTTSTGSLNFSVSKPARANITNLTDLQVTGWVIGDGAVTMTEDVCVYSTRPSGGYTVQATGSGTAGAFTLANGAKTIDYTVLWNAGGVGSLSDSGTSLTAAMVSGPLTHAATDSSTCSGITPGPTARLVVGVTKAEMTGASAGSYTGTLTLMITPN
jgi:hypothetical protein